MLWSVSEWPCTSLRDRRAMDAVARGGLRETNLAAFRHVPYPPQLTGLQVQPSFVSSSPLPELASPFFQGGSLICLSGYWSMKVIFLDPPR